MKGFKTVCPVQVRFRDTDAMGHVNNAVYLSYLELARFEYLKTVLGVRRLEDVRMIVARVEIDYRSPVMLGEDLLVGVRVERLGGASFTMGYRIEERSGRLVAEAKSVQVAYDYGKGKPMKLAPEFIETVRRHDELA